MAARNDAQQVANLAERLGRLIAAEAHAEGLLPVQWEALRYLGRANRFSRTASALTAYLGLTKGTVSQTVKTLESRKLVRKLSDPKDKRKNLLAITAKGHRLLAQDPLENTVSAVASLPSGKQRELASGLSDLLQSRLVSQGRQPFGQCRNCRFFERRHPDGRPYYCGLLSESLAEDDADAICQEQQPR